MKTRWVKQGLGLLSVLLIASCSKSSAGGGGSSPATMASALNVSFSNVKGFVIAPPTSTSTAVETFGIPFLDVDPNLMAASGGQNLYSLNKDGTFTIVTTTTNDQGQSSTTSSTAVPLAVYDTLNFTFFEYSCSGPGPGGTGGGLGSSNPAVAFDNTPCCMVAARKSDAALFCIAVSPQTSNGQNPNGFLPYYPLVAADSTGNFIFVDTGLYGATGSLLKLDFSNPASPTQTTVVDSSTDGAVNEWAINPDGDVLVNIATTQGPPTTLRLYKIGGGFQSISSSPAGCVLSTPANDAAPTSFYYEGASPTVSHNGAVFQLLKSGTTFTVPASTYFDDGSGSIGVVACNPKSGSGNVARTSNRIFVAEPGSTPLTGGGPAPAYFLELVGPSKTLKHTSPLLSSVTGLFAFSGGVVEVGVDGTGSAGLERYDVSGSQFTTLLAPSAYTISTVSVGSAGDVTFSGRRASDNARVLGTITLAAPGGTPTVTIVTTALSGDVQQIQQID